MKQSFASLAEEVELKNFLESEKKMALYRKGIELLKESGIIDLLRTFARPYSVDGGANPNRAVYMAAVAEGAQKTLDDLVYFEPLYAKVNLPKGQVRPLFGARGIALQRGYLTEEDYKDGKLTARNKV